MIRAGCSAGMWATSCSPDGFVFGIESDSPAIFGDGRSREVTFDYFQDAGPR